MGALSHTSPFPLHTFPGATASEERTRGGGWGWGAVFVDGMTNRKIKGGVSSNHPGATPLTPSTTPVPTQHPLWETALLGKHWALWCQAKRMDLESSTEPDAWRQQPSDITRFNCPKISRRSKVVTVMIASELFQLARCQLYTTILLSLPGKQYSGTEPARHFNEHSNSSSAINVL